MQETTATTFQAVQLPFPEQERLVCPRCDSTNTKFCYYNNYNLSQPRHFCRNCKRYWTKGGSLRNIPVGGGTRKNSSKRNAKRPNPDPIPDNNGLRQQRLQEPAPANTESSQSKHGTTANRQLGSLLQGASPNGSISGQEPGTDPRPGGGSEEDRVIMQEDGLVACAHFCRFL